MKVLFVSGGNSFNEIIPFIKSQGESLIKEGIEVNYFQIIGKGIKGYLKNVKKLRDVIKKGNYDVIHSHYSHSALVSLLTLSHEPLVLSLMGSDTYGDRDEKGRIKISGFLDMFFTQFIQFIPNKIIVKSNNIANYLVVKKKISVIPNGINFNFFKPMDKNDCRKKLNLSLDKKIILFLANTSDSRKNFKLLEAAKDLIKINNIEILTPFPIKQEFVPQYLNACDVFVLTSYMEGSPNVIKEAMACNCPIVSTNVGDVKEVIKSTEGCYIAEFNPNDIAAKIEEALFLSQRTKGRENIKHLESSIIAKRIISLYKSLLK